MTHELTNKSRQATNNVLNKYKIQTKKKLTSNPNLLPQETASGLPVQDPDQLVPGSARPEPGLLGELLAGLFGEQRTLYECGGYPALFCLGLLHMDGFRSFAHVLCPGESLQRLRALIHPQVLCAWMG